MANPFFASNKTMPIYYKYSGTGNSFVLIDNREKEWLDIIGLAKEACTQMKVDGLLVIEPSEKAEFKMRIVNSDGSEASMCGNGSRCAAFWAKEKGGMANEFRIETLAGVLDAFVASNIVKVRLTDPTDLRLVKGFRWDGAEGDIYYVDTGVPHVVSEVKGIKSLDVAERGLWIRNHKEFSPEGANATFYQYLDDGRIQCRVFERGVEGETYSCGTGSAAGAIIGSLKYHLKSPVKVLVQSGEELNIYFRKIGEKFTEVYLEGPVDDLGEGVFKS